MSASTIDRLSLLGDNVRISLLERKRSVNLNLTPDPKNESEIAHSLQTMLHGIEELEKEQARLEETGGLSSQQLRDSEDHVIRLRKLYDNLHNQFTSPLPPPSRVAQATTTAGRTNAGSKPYSDRTDEEARDALMNANSRRGKSVRFSESLVEDDDEIGSMDNTQLLSMHNRIMEEQDESIDRLAESITRQRELSIQIGDELDSHAQLLDEVEILTDRQQTRLDTAKKRMDHIYKKARENWSLVVIGTLILILLLLIIILK